MRKLRMLVCVVLIAVIVMSGIAKNAQAIFIPESPIPGLSIPAFHEALVTDRLMLKPVTDVLIRIPAREYVSQIKRYDQAVVHLGGTAFLEDTLPSNLPEVIEFTAENFQSGRDYLSLSPDGSRMLIINQGVPMMAELKNHTLKFILPDATMNRDYFARYYERILQMPEDQHVTWSPDGRYVAIASPDLVLSQLRMTANILLLDLEKGVSRTADRELEQKANLRWDEITSGSFPVKATFSRDSKRLYIESLNQEDEVSLFRSHDLQTRKMTDLAQWDFETMQVMGIMADTEQGVLRATGSMRQDDPIGISFQTPSGERRILCDISNTLPDYPIRLRSALHITRGKHALLTTVAKEEFPFTGVVLQLFRIDEVESSVFYRALAIDKDASPADRLVQVNPMAWDGAYVKNSAFDGLLRVNNATLSSDGTYLLMRAGKNSIRGLQSLYLCDLMQGITGEVIVPEGALDTAACMVTRLAGLKWSGNRILINRGGAYHLYELTVSSK